MEENRQARSNTCTAVPASGVVVRAPMGLDGVESNAALPPLPPAVIYCTFDADGQSVYLLCGYSTTLVPEKIKETVEKQSLTT